MSLELVITTSIILLLLVIDLNVVTEIQSFLKIFDEAAPSLV